MIIEFNADVDEIEIDPNPRWEETTPSGIPGNPRGIFVFLKGFRPFTMSGSSTVYNHFLEMKLGVILAPPHHQDEREFFQLGKKYHVTIEEVTP